MTPDVFGMNTDLLTQATKIMNMNNDKQNSSMRYVKNCFYVWKHCSADDNVKIKKLLSCNVFRTVMMRKL